MKWQGRGLPIAAGGAFVFGNGLNGSTFADCIDPLFASLALPDPRESRPTLEVGVTSAAHGEGVSTIAYHLAVRAARSLPGEVVLVHASPRPVPYAVSLRMARQPGFRELFSGSARLDDCVERTGPDALSILPYGGTTSLLRPWGPDTMAAAFTELRARYAVTVLDLPPVSRSGDCLSLAASASGVVLAIEARRVGQRRLRRTCQMLRQAGANVLGAVFNKQRGGGMRRYAAD
jgi:receptor protein-tyrosine kinase